MFSKSLSSASSCWRMFWHAFNRWTFCSSVKRLGTILAHTFRTSQVSWPRKNWPQTNGYQWSCYKVITPQSEGLGTMALGILKYFYDPLISQSESCGSQSFCRGQLSWTPFRMPKVSTKLVWTISLSIPASLAMTQMVKQRSLQTICRTISMLASVMEVQGLPDLGSSSTSSLPSTNRLCHSKTLVLDMEESPWTSRNIFKVSVVVFPSLTQNLMLILCSIIILQLNSYRHKNSIRYRTTIFFSK